MNQKVLLMGKESSGKTSMRSVIFSSVAPSATSRLGATIDIEHNQIRFLGSLLLNLLDCGGQDSFIESYLTPQRAPTVFSEVGVFIYVFDVESRDSEKEARYYKDCLACLKKYSPKAHIFAMIHKMDLVDRRDRRETFLRKRLALLEASEPMNVRAFGTSIYDESLYKAWSRIVHTLIPNGPELTRHLTTLGEACGAVEVVLFERNTFLLIARSEQSTDGESPADDQLVSLAPHSVESSTVDPLTHEDDQPPLPTTRFEKTSSLIKAFKHSCSRFGEQFHSMEMHLPNYTAVLDVLTPNSYVLVVAADNQIHPAAIKLNVRLARSKFQELHAGLAR